MRGLNSMRGKRKPISLRGWLFHYNPVRYTTDFILPTAQRFQFTLPTLRTETQHPDSECLSCEVWWVVLNVVCIDIEVGEWYCACVERWRFNEHEGTSSKRNPFT